MLARHSDGDVKDVGAAEAGAGRRRPVAEALVLLDAVLDDLRLRGGGRGRADRTGGRRPRALAGGREKAPGRAACSRAERLKEKTRRFS